MSVFKVRCYIFQARDLPPADSDGTSDPELHVHGDGTDQLEFRLSTLVIEDNMNPMYYEALEYTTEATSIDDLPPFIVDCFDFDESIFGKDGHDFLCRAVIHPYEKNGARIFTDDAELELAKDQ